MSRRRSAFAKAIECSSHIKYYLYCHLIFAAFTAAMSCFVLIYSLVIMALSAAPVTESALSPAFISAALMLSCLHQLKRLCLQLY